MVCINFDKSFILIRTYTLINENTKRLLVTLIKHINNDKIGKFSIPLFKSYW
jgi:hypothetical protein